MYIVSTSLPARISLHIFNLFYPYSPPSLHEMLCEIISFTENFKISYILFQWIVRYFQMFVSIKFPTFSKHFYPISLPFLTYSKHFRTFSRLKIWNLVPDLLKMFPTCRNPVCRGKPNKLSITSIITPKYWRAQWTHD